MSGAARPERVTVGEIAAIRGVSVNTIHYHRGHVPGFPQPAGRRMIPGRRGQPQLEYDAVAVDAFYRAKEAAHRQARRGPTRPPGVWDPGDRVNARTGAARLGVPYSTFRTFPALYGGHPANPFPARGPDGRYRWGDLAAWDDRRPGSGRRDSHPRRGAARGEHPGEPVAAQGRRSRQAQSLPHNGGTTVG